MLGSKRLVLLSILGLTGPALAQDGGSPWGQPAPKTAPRTAEEEGDQAADGAEQEKTAPRGETEEASTEEEAALPELDMAEAGAAVERIELSVDPQTSPPGGVVLVTAIFWTEDDKAVPGVVFDLLAKDGSVGEVAETDGRYTAAFEVSTYAEDEAKVSVITEDGKHEMALITVEGEAVTPLSEPVPPEAEAVAKPEKPPKEKKAPATRDPMWLHFAAGGAGALYAYAQEPDPDDSGPLIEDTLAFGGDAGAGATAAGAQLAGTVWVPDMEYLGFQGHFRFLSYAVQSGAFEGTANDFLYDVGVYAVGRVPLDVAGGRVWAGGRLGFQYDDFLSFQGCLDPGCQVDFTTVNTPGLGLGPRGGLEMGPVFAELGYTAGLARFTQPYRNALDADLGVIVFDPVALELGVDVIGRTIALASKDSGDVRGTIKDTQTVLSLSVGAVF